MLNGYAVMYVVLFMLLYCVIDVLLCCIDMPCCLYGNPHVSPFNNPLYPLSRLTAAHKSIHRGLCGKYYKSLPYKRKAVKATSPARRPGALTIKERVKCADIQSVNFNILTIGNENVLKMKVVFHKFTHFMLDPLVPIF